MVSDTGSLLYFQRLFETFSASRPSWLEETCQHRKGLQEQVNQAIHQEEDIQSNAEVGVLLLARQ